MYASNPIGRLAGALAFAALAGPVFPSGARGPVPDSGRLAAAADSAAARAVARLGLAAGDTLCWDAPEPAGALSRFVEFRFIAVMEKRGIRLRPDADPASCGKRLLVLPVRASVSYAEDTAGVFLRRAEVSVSLRLVSGGLVRADTAAAALLDRLSGPERAAAGRGDLLSGGPIAAEPSARAAGWRLLEPLFAILAVGGIAYSFFSIRSDG